MSSKITGSCNCGAVTIALTQGVPATHVLCGCTSCRKSGGTIHSSNLVVPSDQIVIAGPTKTFTSTGSSGSPVHREFCPECGSPIRTQASTAPDASFVKGGLFAPGSLPEPEAEIFRKNAEQWQTPLKGSKQVEEQ